MKSLLPDNIQTWRIKYNISKDMWVFILFLVRNSYEANT